MPIFTGTNQTDIPLKDRLSNPELRNPGKSLHFFGQQNPVIFNDSPPYTANVIQETIDQMPVKQLSITQKLYDYRGGAAIVAAPGDVLPKVYGTTIVQGRVIWASEPYLNANNRPVIDIAYGLAQGVIDAMLKIYAGNDKQLIYNADALDGTINGAKYWKRLKFYNGAADQEKNNIIISHETRENTPNYRGLSYVVFKALKLHKFNKTAPDLWFVIGRSVTSEVPDVYEEFFYSGSSAAIKSIIGYDNKIFGVGNLSVAGYVDLTDNSWNVIDGIGFIVPFQNALAVMNGKLYGVSSTGLYEYNDDTTWTQKLTFNGRCITSNAAENLLLIGHASSVDEMQTYDGTTVNGLGNLLSSANPVACRIVNSSNPYTAASNLGVTRKIWQYIDPTWTEIESVSTNMLNFIFVNFEESDGWLTRTQTGGVTATLAVESFPSGTNYTDVVNVVGSPLSCYALNYFSNKPHVGVSNTGTDGGYVYRLDTDTSTFTKLPRPSGVPTDTTVSVTGSTVFNNGLYICSNKGIWRQGDV